MRRSRGSFLNRRFQIGGLAALGILLAFSFRIGFRLQGTEHILQFVYLTFVQTVLFLCAVALVRGYPATRRTLLLIAGFALLFRGIAVVEPPNLSRDAYRYIWDGRVQASGVSPYRYAPADPALAHLRDPLIFDKIARRDYALSAYPPAGQMLFWLTTRISESVTWMKTTMVLFDLATLAVIAMMLRSLGKPLERAIVYAWHPLVIWEVAGNGHLDAASVFWIVAALYLAVRGRSLLAAALVGVGTLTKLLPIAVLPAVARGRQWKPVAVAALTIVVGYSIYVPDAGTNVFGFLPNYVQEERMDTGGRFFLLSAIHGIPGLSAVPPWMFIAVVIAILGLMAFRAFEDRDLRPQALIGRVLMILVTVTIAMSQIFPWYYLWLVPFLAWRDNLAVLFLTLVTPVFYLTWFGESWDWSFGLNAIAMIPTFFLMAIAPFLRTHKEIP